MGRQLPGCGWSPWATSTTLIQEWLGFISSQSLVLRVFLPSCICGDRCLMSVVSRWPCSEASSNRERTKEHACCDTTP